MKRDVLWYRVFWSWFAAIALFYDFTALPIAAGIAAYGFSLFKLWTLEQSVAISIAAALAPIPIFLLTAFMMAEDWRESDDRWGMHVAAEVGLRAAFYLNPIGLAYGSLCWLARKVATVCGDIHALEQRMAGVDVIEPPE
jgi:hypothetical protein